MTSLQIMILSVIQGFTEFLPVSSSGHLILLSKLTSFPDQGLDIDVAVHVGSILAVMLYFAKDIWAMLCGVIKTRFVPSFKNVGSHMFWLIVVGTIPAVIAGLTLHYIGMEGLRSTKIIGWNILIFALVLWFADNHSLSVRRVENMDWLDALAIGLAQCLALVPGTSRSGITITMSRFLGIERREAARFCMLLSIPTIAGAGLLVAYEMYQIGSPNIGFALQGIVYSFIASMVAIWVMMSWLKNRTFLPFVLYRIALGMFLLLYSYGYIGNWAE